MISQKVLVILPDAGPGGDTLKQRIQDACTEGTIHFADSTITGSQIENHSYDALIYFFQQQSQLLPVLQLLRKKLPDLVLITIIQNDTDPASGEQMISDGFVFSDQLARLPFALIAGRHTRQMIISSVINMSRLAEAEQTIHHIFYQHPLPKWIYDFETLKFLEVNDAAVAHYGYQREEFLQMTIKDIRPDSDVPQLVQDLQRIKDEPNIRRGQWRHIKKGGESILVETTAYFVPRHGQNARMVVARDVTEAVRVAKEKEFVSSNLAALINNTNDLIWSVDAELRLISCNTAFADFFEKLNGNRPSNGDVVLTATLGDKIATIFRLNYERALAGESFSAVTRLGKPVSKWVEMSFYPIYDANKIAGTACFCRDISGQRKAERDLRSMEKKLNHEKVQAQKKVTLAILEGQERERNYIGRELHDNINQILASAKLRLSSISTEHTLVSQQLKDPMDLIDSAVREIRALTRGYVAPLKEFSLREMIQYLMDTVHASTSIKANLDYGLKADSLSSDLKLNLYRIIQEQLNNILKYAEASAIQIEVRQYYKFISVVITDDGQGFDVSAKRAGIGLTNMRNRVELFNGVLSIESEPGKGCKVHMVIPAAANTFQAL